MPAFFIPARDSRHRTACFALYRALLRQIPHIHLPDELAPRPGWINPVRFLVRSGFRRNRTDTSPRLVTSALNNGYKFLALLTQARTPSSPEHKSLLSFLRDREARFPPPHSPAESGPAEASMKPRQKNKQHRIVKHDVPPMLTRVPGETPVFKPTFRPRPLSELSGGVRKVPVLDLANGISFLRISKPQSPWLSNYLRHLSLAREKRILLLRTMYEESYPDAQWEDEWEARMRDVCEQEGVPWPEEEKEDTSDETYAASLETVMFYLTDKLRQQRDEIIARGKANFQIVEAEKRLAAEEKEAKKREKLKAKRRIVQDKKAILDEFI